MKNSDLKFKKSEKNLNNLGIMLKLISQEHPKDASNYAKLAEHVENIFDVTCTKEDVENYELSYINSEDYELESRRIDYGFSGY